MNSKRLSRTEHAVLRTIITNEGISRAGLAEKLSVSMPTIASALKRLQELRYVTQTQGVFDSTGGRKKDAYSFAYSRCICIGVLVRKRTVHVIATNLRGDIVSRDSLNLDDFKAAGFYDGLAMAIESFIATSAIDTRHLRGIGVIVAPHAALDDSSENRIRETIESRMSYPVRIMREPLAQAAAETLFQPQLKEAACLYLNSTMSSAFIRGGRYVKNSSFVEHTTLFPHALGDDIPQCECGQYGCAQLYCSAQALLKSSGIHDSTVWRFMNHVRDSDYTHTKVFNTYLDYLALLIHNIRMVVQVPVIVGGEVAQYLDSSDISELRSRVRALAPSMLLTELKTLNEAKNPNVIKSACNPDQAIIGAAYVLAQDYLDSLLNP
ncbi:ROK family transcriptional regulator [Alloscardovia criceti]|uniref:ROK family transcriptional regulator n=1 Tax=Alloscardovia criceti TaxID=356828 RepID=UPI00036A6A49|nr:ROK family transcriptional regulator [Alloscardovia criceti]